MRDYNAETSKRVEFIRKILSDSGTFGIVYGNSGGKDATLVGILCKMACDNTVGLIMPAGSNQNYGSDTDDANKTALQFNIETRTVDLKAAFEAMKSAIGQAAELTDATITNIAPRLRMTTLYAVAQSEGRLVAGTGNKSEAYMGYFTKWGDGAHDFNPISDLTVTEIYEFLAHLGASESIINKAPSAGLFDGQTDEGEMGITYKAIDEFILTGVATDEDKAIIERYHRISEHKRNPIVTFGK
jgi:NAD+ synthase